MVDKNKVLDEAMRRENKFNLKKIFTYTLLTLVLGSVFSFSVVKNYDRVKFSKKLTGVVESIKTVTADDLQEQRMFVIKLQNSTVIEIPVKSFASIGKGEGVKVLRQELESGQMRYSIILPIEE